MINYLRQYETIVIYKPDLNDDSLQKMQDRVTSIVEKNHGKMITVNKLGKRKLAYQVKKQTLAHYLHYVYLGEGPLTRLLAEDLKNFDQVMKHMTIIIKDRVNPDDPSDIEENIFVPRREDSGEGFE